MRTFFDRFMGSNRTVIAHEGSDIVNLEAIGDNVDFTRDGNGLTVVTGDVGQNVNITIDGSSRLEIRGNIGRCCKIYKSGSGTLTIAGTVAGDLELTLLGQGNVLFTQQLPANVNIKKRGGTAEVICAGQPFAVHTQGYRHHNLGVSSTGQRAVVQSQQPARVLPQPSQPSQPSRPSQPSQPSIDRPKVQSSKIDNTEDNYNPLTKQYIDRCGERQYEIIANRIEKLNLIPEEEPLFESFVDCITMVYFDDIPVVYDENYYNLSTLLYLHGNNKPDPFSRQPIKLAGIASARIMYDNLDKAIDELNKKRAAAKQNSVEHHDIAVEHHDANEEQPKTLSL